MAPNRTDVIAYVPIRPRAGRERLDLEMKPLSGGGLALLVYTSLDRLLSCLGARQHWVALTEQGLAQVKTVTRYRELMIDQPIPDEMRYAPALPKPVTERHDDEQDFRQPASRPAPVADYGTKRRR